LQRLLRRFAPRNDIIGVSFFCLLLSSAPSLARVGTSITGTVTDTSGLPLTGAHVTVTEQQTGAVAGWNGVYRVSELPPGNYILTASHLGYHPEVCRGVAVREGAVIRIDFTLQLQPLVRPDATVSAPHSHQFYIGNDRALVTRSGWSSCGARTVGDALRSVPGLTVLEGDGSQRLSLRGSPSRTVKVDLDGIPINDAGTGEAEVGQIDLNQISAIVVEFAGLGGMVHLQTAGLEVAEDTRRALTFSLGQGGFDGSEAAAGLETEARRLSGAVIFNRKSDRGDFSYRLDDGSSSRRVNNQIAASSGLGKLRLQRGGWKLDGGLYYQSLRRGVPGLIYAPPTPEARLTASRLSIGLRGQHLTERTGIKFTGHITEYTGRFLNPAEQYDPSTGLWVTHIPEESRQSGLGYGLSVSLIRGLEQQSFRAEYRLKTDEYLGEDLLRGHTTVGGVGLGEARRTVHGFELGLRGRDDVGRWSCHLTPTLLIERILDAGLGSYDAVSPAVSGSLERRLSFGALNLTAGWGRSLAAPPFNARFTVENIFAVGNRNLKPERGESLSIGLNIWSGEAASVIWRVGTVRSHRQVNDLIVWRRNYQGKYYPDNLARASITGTEISGSISSGNGKSSLFGSYIYNDSVNDTPGDINQGKMVPLVAGHSGSAAATFNLRGVGVTLSGRWVGRRYSTESNLDPLSTAGMGLPPYEVYDLNCTRSWRLGRLFLTAQLSIDNLLDRSYRVIERSPMPGRSIYTRLSFNI